MTDFASAGTDPAAGRERGATATEQLAAWAETAAAARSALAMIPTSRALRSRQEQLVRALEQVAGGRLPMAGQATTPTQLLEETLAGLREPASARPYDLDRASDLRRRVLAAVVGAADGLVGVQVREESREAWVLAEIRAAGRLARALLDDLPSGSDG